MIDTIKFYAFPTPSQVEKIKLFLRDYVVIDNQTGESGNVFTRGQLSGSFDYRIRIAIKDRRWLPQIQPEERIHIGRLTIRHQDSKKVLQIVPEYLDIELSLAKFSDNVNFLNSTQEQDLMRLLELRRFFSKKFGFEFPHVDTWEYRRVDIGRNYLKQTLQDALDYIDSLKSLEYPRRSQKSVHSSSVNFKGSLSLFKIYNKFLEFKAHDYKRLREYYKNEPLKIKQILKLTEGIVRTEVELKLRWLQTREIFSVYDLFNLDFNQILDDEIKKVLGAAMTKRIMFVEEVRAILQNAKEDGLLTGRHIGVDAAVNVWTFICLKGKKHAIEIFGRRKVNRALLIYEDYGIPLSGAVQEIHEEHVRGVIQLEEFTAVGDDLSERYYHIANL